MTRPPPAPPALLLAAALVALWPLLLWLEWRKLRRGRANSAPFWMRRFNRWLVYGRSA